MSEPECPPWLLAGSVLDRWMRTIADGGQLSATGWYSPPPAGATSVGSLEPMTFLKQPGLWRKQRFDDETSFARASALRFSVPYFLRSMSAVSYLEKIWHASMTLPHTKELPTSGAYDDQAP
jgi:hypothetical protein